VQGDREARLQSTTSAFDGCAQVVGGRLGQLHEKRGKTGSMWGLTKVQENVWMYRMQVSQAKAIIANSCHPISWVLVLGVSGTGHGLEAGSWAEEGQIDSRTAKGWVWSE
jgi:hypothetical protein